MNQVDWTNQRNQRNQINQTNPTDLSRLSCLPHETLLLFHWGSEGVRGEMRPALWSVKTTLWGAYFTGTRETSIVKNKDLTPFAPHVGMEAQDFN